MICSEFDPIGQDAYPRQLSFLKAQKLAQL
jgi:hypothetical protein